MFMLVRRCEQVEHKISQVFMIQLNTAIPPTTVTRQSKGFGEG